MQGAKLDPILLLVSSDADKPSRRQKPTEPVPGDDEGEREKARRIGALTAGKTAKLKAAATQPAPPASKIVGTRLPTEITYFRTNP